MRIIALPLASSCLTASLILLPGQTVEGPQQGEPAVARMMRTCQKCHSDVYKEWESSGHARSWSNPAFQAAIEGRPDKGESCAACHAPASVLETGPGKMPRARSRDREVGVNCITCHVKGRTYYGPISSKAHGGVEVLEAYRSAEWCASCHGQKVDRSGHNQFASWESSPAAAAGKTCQSCHMPPVERPLAAAEDPRIRLRDLQGPQPCRKHAFAPPEAGGREQAESARISIHLEGGEAVVSLESLAGHGLPAAEGSELRLQVEFEGSGKEQVRAWDGENPLQPEQEQTLRMPLPQGTTGVRARLLIVKSQEPGRTGEVRRILAEADTGGGEGPDAAEEDGSSGS